MRGRKGFTLVEIMIVVAIIGIIIAIAIPGFIRAREVARARSCQANIAKVDGAMQTYALENNMSAGDACVMADLLPPADGSAPGYLKKEPLCPGGGGADASYEVTAIDTAPICDYAEPAWLVTATDNRFAHDLDAGSLTP